MGAWGPVEEEPPPPGPHWLPPLGRTQNPLLSPARPAASRRVPAPSRESCVSARARQVRSAGGCACPSSEETPTRRESQSGGRAGPAAGQRCGQAGAGTARWPARRGPEQAGLPGPAPAPHPAKSPWKVTARRRVPVPLPLPPSLPASSIHPPALLSSPSRPLPPPLASSPAPVVTGCACPCPVPGPAAGTDTLRCPPESTPLRGAPGGVGRSCHVTRGPVKVGAILPGALLCLEGQMKPPRGRGTWCGSSFLRPNQEGRAFSGQETARAKAPGDPRGLVGWGELRGSSRWLEPVVCSADTHSSIAWRARWTWCPRPDVVNS